MVSVYVESLFSRHCNALTVDILILEFMVTRCILVTSLISHMSYIKSKNRSSTADAAVVDAIKCKRYESVDESREIPMHDVAVNVREALEHKISWV